MKNKKLIYTTLASVALLAVSSFFFYCSKEKVQPCSEPNFTSTTPVDESKPIQDNPSVTILMGSANQLRVSIQKGNVWLRRLGNPWGFDHETFDLVIVPYKGCEKYVWPSNKEITWDTQDTGVNARKFIIKKVYPPASGKPEVVMFESK